MSRTRIAAPLLALSSLIALTGALAPGANAAMSAAQGMNASASTTALAKKIVQRITLLHSKPTFKTGPLIEKGLGKVAFFAAALSDKDGARFGQLTGTILTVDVDTANVQDEARERSLTFTLPGGQILAHGISYYPASGLEIAANKSVIIAVIGGTGTYIGASGQVTTTRLDDGTYRQVIALVR
jgi:hypothetical protein